MSQQSVAAKVNNSKYIPQSTTAKILHPPRKHYLCKNHGFRKSTWIILKCSHKYILFITSVHCRKFINQLIFQGKSKTYNFMSRFIFWILRWPNCIDSCMSHISFAVIIKILTIEPQQLRTKVYPYPTINTCVKIVDLGNGFGLYQNVVILHTHHSFISSEYIIQYLSPAILITI